MNRRGLPCVALLAAVLAGCAGEPPDGSATPSTSDPSAVLLDCPQGDRAWRAALAGASSPEAKQALATRLERVAVACEGRWEPHWTLGELRFRAGERTARDPFEAALDLARELDDPVGIACAGNRVGVLDFLAGDLDASRDGLDEALSAARRASRDDLTAFVLNNLAALLKARAELPRAIVVLDEASRLLSELELDKPARDAAYNQGVLTMELGDVAQAEAIFDRVFEEAGRAGDTRTASLAALARGNLRLSLDDPRGARAWFDRVTDDAPRVVQATELGLGRVDLAEGRLASAVERLGRAAELAERNEIKIFGLLAEAWRANALWRAGRDDEALDLLASVSREAEAIGARQKAVWFAEWTIGRIRRARDEPAAATASFRRAVEILEGQDERLDPLGAGLHFLLDRTDPYVDLALALFDRDGATDELFAVVESSHARALRRVVGESARPTTTVAELQASLGADDLVLDFLLGRERGLVLAVSRGRFEAFGTPGWQELSEPLRRYRDALQRPLTRLDARARPMDDLGRDLDAGRALRRALIDPARELVGGARRIYSVPDRDLALIPLAALPGEDGGFVGDTVETAVLPMAGALPRWGTTGRRVLLGGDPAFPPGAVFASLPRTRFELDNLRDVWGADATDLLRSDGFTLDRFVASPLRDYGTIHLATHAVASTLDPRKCAVVFSGGDRLGFDRIARLDLDDALVVLSACRSGEGETIPGQGVVGLGWAFLIAGAKGLAVSLWNVEDASASDLMTEFHRRLRAGDDPVAALARARRWLREEQPHPAFWSPFVLYVGPRRPAGAS